MTSTHEKTINLTIAIPPRKLGFIERAIIEHLNGLKSKYVPEAEGVMLGYSNLDILNDHGIIVDDQPYTFWKIRFTANIFEPTGGGLFKGRIHKIQKQYLIVRAMDFFTATIAIPESLYEDSVIQNLVVDQDIYFKLTCSTGGDYRGELDEECIELTSSLVVQQINLDDDSEHMFDYSKDFEY